MKFTWKYRYVPEGQLEPDNHNRWALDCYISVHINKALPQYKVFKPILNNKKYIDIRIASIDQKGTRGSSVPSVHDKFCASIPSFEDCGNTGFSHKYNFFSNDIEDLKRQVEEQFIMIQKVFSNCL